MKHKLYKKVVLIILDGFGIAPVGRGNAISRARTPTLNYLVNNYPSLSLQASGPLVGLPWGEMGNSEVGHLNIGAGRIVGQDLPRISNAISSGSFFKNKVLLEAIAHAKQYNSALHLMGMVSPGGVHSLDEHLYALLSLAAEQGQNRVYIHMFTDGRDTQPKVALDSLQKLNEKISQIGVGKIATMAGRFYAMDRGGHWGQTAMMYQAMVYGQGETAHSAAECVNKNYRAQIFDEMIKPTVIVDENNRPTARVGDNDAVIFFNFRSDRGLQITEAFVSPQTLPPEFLHPKLQNLYFVTMTEYSSALTDVHVAFAPMVLNNNLAEVVSKSGLTQFHIAESEKYAHVTAFFNCGRTEKFLGEERVIVTSPSNNARNYSDHPEMSAEKLTDELTQAISSSHTNFFVANFANTDMVGHTGNLAAAILAVEFVDSCVKKILDACMLTDAALLITADHGNVEQMINPRTGDIDKDHTTNPVPFLLAANELKFSAPFDRGFASLSARVPAGVVCDIAPTVLDFFGLPKPKEMTGISLLDVIDDVPKKH